MLRRLSLGRMAKRSTPLQKFVHLGLERSQAHRIDRRLICYGGNSCCRGSAIICGMQGVLPLSRLGRGREEDGELEHRQRSLKACSG